MTFWFMEKTRYDQRLEIVLMRLVEAGVTLNLDKCQFSTDRVKFLGHVIVVIEGQS